MNSSYFLYLLLGMEIACRELLESSDCALSFLAALLMSFALPVAAALMLLVCQSCPADPTFSSQLPPALHAWVLPVSCCMSLLLLVNKSLCALGGVTFRTVTAEGHPW